MKKPQLCLALSGTLSLMQASLLPALSAPETGAIWQKIAVSAKVPTTSGGAKKKVAHVASSPVRQTNCRWQSSVGSTLGAQGHSLLFLSSKGREAGGLSGTLPAAALTIHPSMLADATGMEQGASATSPTAISAAAIPPVVDSPIVVPEAAAYSATTGTNGLKAPKAKHLLAQLAPDQLIAQGDQRVPTTPIPPVVTGTVDLEEFKSSNVIDLKVSQSRTFKLKNKIVRTSISDPSVAEPVVVAENQIVLLGKSPGGATIVLWDDAGNSMAVDLRVSRDFSQLQAALREIDPRIIVKAFSVAGSDRVLLLGDVDHPESVIKAFGSANVFMDDRGMNIQVANSRLINARIGEIGTGGGGGGGGQTGQLAQLSSVDKYTFFPNLSNNIAKAQVMTSDGGRVTSLIKVRKVPLIVLHVTFMEMNSVAARELGAQLGFNFVTNHFAMGIGGTGGTSSPLAIASAPPINFGAATGMGPFTVGPTSFVSAATVTPFLPGGIPLPTTGIGQAVLSGPSGLISNAVLLGAPGGSAFGLANLSNLFYSGSSIPIGQGGILSINPVIQGIITHSRARILAEPTLVTISGERASYLAGGEIPIIQSVAAAGATSQSVVFEPFGLRLNIIPVLLENGNINLQVAPEERLISSVLAFQPSSLTTSVPGFTTRKAQTMVEMKPGQELFIAGMISTNSGRDLIKTPVLGEIPVIGALYRSKSFTKNESELVVAVRPEIILPGAPGQLKLPEEIGRVEGPRDTNLFQVEPTVVDERHYTSGRSERYQKTSPTLPEGSPVPDNE
jgi:Flp pilus assembly secretin CpaC